MSTCNRKLSNPLRDRMLKLMLQGSQTLHDHSTGAMTLEDKLRYKAAERILSDAYRECRKIYFEMSDAGF